jgi:tyrosinase
VAVALLGLGLRVTPLVVGVPVAVVVLIAGLWVWPLKREVARRPARHRREIAAYRWSRLVHHRPAALAGAGLLVTPAVPVLGLRCLSAEFLVQYASQRGGTPMGVRGNAWLLGPDQVAALRQGFESLYGLRDERGYGFLAGVHGLPLPVYCEHGTDLFLPWHRAYLYVFERALQDRVPMADLPWWDWSSPDAHREGLPPAYRGSGTRNPLAAGPVTLSAADLRLVRDRLPGSVTAGSRPRTRRDPDQPDQLPRAETVARALASRTFTGFSRLLEGIHNGVHGWVAGSMAAVPVAAFDPIFWAHHSMIDRLWYLWQLSPNGVDPPRTLLDRPLPPFPMTVRDTLDITTLGYEYAAQAVG